MLLFSFLHFFFAILAVFFSSLKWPFNLWTHISWKRIIPWKRHFKGSWYSYFFNYIHSLFHLRYKFYTVRPKKIRQNSLSLKLDLDRLNGILMTYIYFYNLNLIAEGILILCMSLFYTKWRKGNFFYEFWAILFDTLFYSTHFRSIFFRHFVFFWKITSLENITEFQN